MFIICSIYQSQVEILAKKYEDKYKQVGDVSSKLTTEEATFRDIQVRLDMGFSSIDSIYVRSLLFLACFS